MFPGRFLRAVDLDGKPPVDVAIRDVVQQQMFSRKHQAEVSGWVAYFRHKGKDLERGLVLNVTNANSIAGIVGSDDSTDWPGHSITLFVTDVRVGGHTERGIRVREPVTTVASNGTNGTSTPELVEGSAEPDDDLDELSAALEPEQPALIGGLDNETADAGSTYYDREAEPRGRP